jgi:hypothetical protein
VVLEKQITGELDQTLLIVVEVLEDGTWLRVILVLVMVIIMVWLKIQRMMLQEKERVQIIQDMEDMVQIMTTILQVLVVQE